MIYANIAHGRMGCSVKEIAGLGHGVVNKPEAIKKLHQLTANYPSVTLCVTAGQQNESVGPTLKEAGFVPLLEYTNRAYHHRTKCILWAFYKQKAKKAGTTVNKIYEKDGILKELQQIDHLKDVLIETGVFTKKGTLKQKYKKKKA